MAEIYRPPTQMYVTTDAVAVSCLPGEGLRVLLIKRSREPFSGRWALPGGFVEEEEDLPFACLRELKEETGIRPAAIAQVGAWGKPGRDPRGRNVSVAYLCAVRAAGQKTVPGSDASRAQWHPTHSLPSLAFDHDTIIAAGLRKLKTLVAETCFVFSLLPESFHMDDLQDVLAAVQGELVTEDEARAVAKRASVVKDPPKGGRESMTYHAPMADFLAALRSR